MRNSASALRETTEPMGPHKAENAMMVSACPDEEIFHIQADGFWGEEMGFQDAELYRRLLPADPLQSKSIRIIKT